MEYAEGKIIEGLLDEKLAPVHEKLNWILKSMVDNGAVPKEEKKDVKNS